MNTFSRRKTMSFKISKCETCKKFTLLNEAPWAACTIYPKFIPSKYLQNTTDSGKSVDCKEYEFNPNWQNRGDN